MGLFELLSYFINKNSFYMRTKLNKTTVAYLIYYIILFV